MKRAISFRVFHERFLLNVAIRCVAEVRDFQEQLLLIKTVKGLKSGRYGPYPAITIDVYNSTNAEVKVDEENYECAVIWHKVGATSAIPFGP